MSNTTSGSHRSILRSSSIIGGAKIVNVLVSLIRMKLVAVLIGPTGVGLLGLFSNLTQTASSIAALGINNSGTRQIAAARAEKSAAAMARAQYALFWCGLVLAIGGALAFWLLSPKISAAIFDGSVAPGVIAWLSLGVALSVVSASRNALLTGMRRIGDIARASVFAGIITSTATVVILWIWGMHGLIATVLVAPAATLVSFAYYIHRLDFPATNPPPLREIVQEASAIVKLGVAFMLGGLVALLGGLATRTLVQRSLGPEALGQFQAAWSLGVTYLSFVLSAMGTDYFPRLTAVINDRAAVRRLVNEQTEVLLLLAAPALLLLIGFVPWVVRFLYSAEFAPAVDILRWQLLGDVLKLMNWPLGFLIIASGAGKTFVGTQSLAWTIYFGSVLLFLPVLGVTATGVSFLLMQALSLPIVRVVVGWRTGFHWSREVLVHAFVIAVAVVVVDATSRFSASLGAVVGLVLAIATGLWALMHLADMTGATGKLGRAARAGRRLKAFISGKIAK